MIKRFLEQQLLATGLLAAALLLIVGAHAAYSAALGGLVCIIPLAYHGYKVFSQTSTPTAAAILRAVYVGEMKKLMIAAALCFICFKWLNIVPLAFFAGWLMALSTFIWRARALTD